MPLTLRRSITQTRQRLSTLAQSRSLSLTLLGGG
jgi:hypothetical protein